MSNQLFSVKALIVEIGRAYEGNKNVNVSFKMPVNRFININISNLTLEESVYKVNKEIRRYLSICGISQRPDKSLQTNVFTSCKSKTLTMNSFVSEDYNDEIRSTSNNNIVQPTGRVIQYNGISTLMAASGGDPTKHIRGTIKPYLTPIPGCANCSV